MQLCSIRSAGGLVPAVFRPGVGAFPVESLVGKKISTPSELLHPAMLQRLGLALEESGASPTPVETVDLAFPFAPGKVLGIGLNYSHHAKDLDAYKSRTSPASFLKGAHTVIGEDEPIRVPQGIGRVTAEAEVALVIGRDCHEVSEASALDYVAGVVAILDQTAEEVLLEDARYLTRVKNYPTFLCLGSTIMTLDELSAAVGDFSALTVSTGLNGQVRRTAPVSDMTFSPAELLSFHSHVMPFSAGDLLLTGTPGAVAIAPGDEVFCDLGDGMLGVRNRVD